MKTIEVKIEQTVTAKVTKDVYLMVGTGKCGSLRADYNELIAALGEPMRYTSDGSDGKIQVEWIITFSDGINCSIYDWKEYNIKPEAVKEWSVGGSRKAAERLELMIANSKLAEALYF